jgi:hypothetical protein
MSQKAAHTFCRAETYAVGDQQSPILMRMIDRPKFIDNLSASLFSHGLRVERPKLCSCARVPFAWPAGQLGCQEVISQIEGRVNGLKGDVLI